MVIFVGDKPSSLNESPLIPFIGTPSWKTLLKWIDKLEVSSYYVTNSASAMDIVDISVHNKPGNTFVALGNSASKRLNQLQIPHFKLPHPSPRNRMMNDKKLIASILEECHNYLKGSK